MFPLLHQKQVLLASLVFRTRKTHHFLLVQTATLLLSFFLLAATSVNAQVDSSYFLASFQVEFNSWDFKPPYQQMIRTFVPATEGDKIYAHFENQSRLAPGDTMFAYDGTSTKAPLIGAFWGPETIRKKIIKATNIKGGLTLRFVSATGPGRSFWFAKVRPTQPLGTNDVVMSSTPVTTSGGKFYHPSYPFTLRYSDNVTQTLRPATPGAKLQVNFNMFKPGNHWSSTLYVYDGPSTSSPLIGAYIFGRPAYAVRATNPTGELTFQLVGTGQEYDSPDQGWDATISYVTNPCPANLSLPETIPGVYPGHFYQVFLGASPAGNYRYTTTSGVTGLNFTTGEFTIASGNGVIGKSMVVRATNENGCFVEKEYTFKQGPRIPADKSDSLALVDIYNSTNGANWKNKTNWLTGNVETWYGVAIFMGKVNYIGLEDNGLSGGIPASIGNLTALRELNLPLNQLTGSIPTSIGNLTSLDYLALYNNQLSGSIPSSIGNLRSLTFLSFENNQLSGSIPDSISTIKYLERLHLSNNQLSGSVPESIGNLSHLESLDLSDNQLSGSFPASINKISYLGYFNLSNNQFSSLPILDEVEEDNYEYFLQAQNNRLTFESLEPNYYQFNMHAHYGPQDSVGAAGKQTLVIGESLTLSSWIGGTYNQYQWTKNGVDISGATSATFTLSAVSVADQGWYSCKVTNTVVHSLTIHRRRVFVQVTPTTAGCTASGTILRETWVKVKGYDVRTIPINTTPTATRQLTRFEGPSNVTNEYGDRIRGYICPPVSGNYTFWIASDDNSVLYLSSNDQVAAKQRIAWVNGATKPQEWTKFASQQSAPIYLIAGKKYYIESLHKEAYGDDHIAVGWQLPGGVLERPIPGKRLSPFAVPANARLTDSDEEIAHELAAIASLSAAPNPFADQTTICFNATASGRATIAVYDLNGSLVKVLFDDELEKGESKALLLEGTALSSGVYLVKATSPVGVSHLKLVLTK